MSDKAKKTDEQPLNEEWAGAPEEEQAAADPAVATFTELREEARSETASDIKMDAILDGLE